MYIYTIIDALPFGHIYRGWSSLAMSAQPPALSQGSMQSGKDGGYRSVMTPWTPPSTAPKCICGRRHELYPYEALGVSSSELESGVSFRGLQEAANNGCSLFWMLFTSLNSLSSWLMPKRESSTVKVRRGGITSKLRIGGRLLVSMEVKEVVPWRDRFANYSEFEFHIPTGFSR